METAPGQTAEEGALGGWEAEIEQDPEQELEHISLVAQNTLQFNPLGGVLMGNLGVTQTG